MSLPRDLLAHLPSAWTVLSSRPSGLITDVDGTISRIADRPEAARVHPRVPDLLGRLGTRLDLVAAVSGRPTGQLPSMLAVDGMVYVGNHGLEWWEDGRAAVVPEAQAYVPTVAATMRYLRERLDVAGVVVEDKGATGTVHYRLSGDAESARRAILQAVAGCPSAGDLLVAEGRKVVNILPPVRADKGTAVERLIRLRGLRGAIYLGDDATDLDAFRALRAMRKSGACATLAVAVASDEALADVFREADYTLDGVEAVASFLEQAADWANRV